MAQRANISPTWYTWLEQGRGGAPSADVLDRISQALMLTDVEREHLFLLGLGRPPVARYRETDGVTPRLQRVLDALDPSPALIRTATWNVLAWNRAATVMLGDSMTNCSTSVESLPPEKATTHGRSSASYCARISALVSSMFVKTDPVSQPHERGSVFDNSRTSGTRPVSLNATRAALVSQEITRDCTLWQPCGAGALAAR